MALVRWEPARELDSLQGEMNRLFNTFFNTGGGNGSHPQRWVPAMDLVETDEALVLRADLPGLAREDVTIEIKDNVLTVAGERKAGHSSNEEGYYRVERAHGSFSRSLALPDGIDAEAVAAGFENGVLEITIPKPAERQPHRVEIGAGAGAIEGSAEEK